MDTKSRIGCLFSFFVWGGGVSSFHDLSPIAEKKAKAKPCVVQNQAGFPKKQRPNVGQMSAKCPRIVLNADLGLFLTVFDIF